MENPFSRESAPQTLQRIVLDLDGEAEALVAFGPDDATTLTRAKLGERVLRLAAGLAAAGAGRGARVAVGAANSLDALAGCLAVPACGAVVVPVDPQMGGETLAHVLRDADPVLALAPDEMAGRMREAGFEGALYRFEDEGDHGDPLAKLQGNEPFQPRREETADPKDTATLFYTSGTTGKPKGVPLTHANIVSQLGALAESGLVQEHYRLLLPLPLHHVYPFVVGVMMPVALALPVILPHSLTGPEVLRALSEGRATVVLGVPRLYRALVEGIDSRIDSQSFFARSYLRLAWKSASAIRRRLGPSLGRVLLSPLHARFGADLEVVASGGAPLPPELGWRLEGLGWKVAVGYGLTETSPILTVNPPGSRRLESVGRALSGVEVSIDETQGPDEPGVGEILAKGPNVFSGYRHLPDKTAEAFTEDGRYKTGDLGRMDEGWLMVTGRVSTMIVTQGGENVHPDEVEGALSSHRFVKEAGVVEDEGAIGAVAVPDVPAAKAASMDPEEAARQGVNEAARKLPSYMRPAKVVVSAKALERTRLGKVKRHKLAEVYASGGAGEKSHGDPASVEEMAPQDKELLQDQAARAAWDYLAERYPDYGLSPDSDLAGDLGVDSMQWLNLTLDIRSRAHVELDEEAIAGIDTVRDLLAAVAEAGAGGRDKGPDPVAEPEAYLDEAHKRWLAPLSSTQRLLARGLHAFVVLCCRLMFRLEVRGELPRKPVVLAPNHASYLDPFVLAAALPYARLENTQFAGWTGAAFANALTRIVSRLARTVPIDPVRRPGTGLALAAAVLDRGRSLVWFPEGMRSPDGSLQRFQPGLGRVLAERETPVAPVWIEGTSAAMPRGQWWIRPGKVRVVFGGAVSPSRLAREGEGESEAERITSALRARVGELGGVGERPGAG